jgi:penicillin-binding protein 2
MTHPYSDRKYVLAVIFSVIIILFVLRLFYVQIIDEQYKLTAKNQAFRYVTDYPARGNIFDRNGNRLVYNQAAYDLMVIPRQVKELDTLELCRTLEIDRAAFLGAIEKASRPPNSPRKPSVFEKEISVENSALLQEKLYLFPGFYLQPRTLRKYPRPIAAHLLGYVGEVSRQITDTSKYYKEGDYIGISGIERSYENELRGKKGIRIVVVDVHNREQGSYMNGLYDTTAVAGKDLVCTLDADLQEYGEMLMQNKIGSIVAIEPFSGEILAFISSPSYDPNLLVGSVLPKNYSVLQKDTLKPLFNRALMASYPPGSIFKLINALIGLHEGTLTPENTYPCRGGYPVMGGKPKCHPHSSPRQLIGAISTSCNSYFCYVFRGIIDAKKFGTTKRGYEIWRNHVLSFGVGKQLGSDLPYELRGNVPSVAYYEKKFFGNHDFKSSTIVSLSIGQGELGILPLQMANVMCIMANKGYYIIPHIIKSIDTTEINKPPYRKKNYTTIDKKHFDVVVEGMYQAVESGTAAKSRIKHIPYCGKTGTAQNPHGEDHSVFVGFAPKDNPKIAISVIVENAGFGAQWAAPIASLMIEKYLTDSISRPDVEKRMLEGDLIHNRPSAETEP